MSGVAALLRYSLPGVDDIEEDDIDINDLINQEAEEEKKEEEEEKVDARKQKKPEWDEELLYKLLE
jgi:mannitol-1-phosphate/altronate dehydrogenase